MADPRTRAARRGCLILIVSLAAIAAAAFLANRWITRSGPPTGIIREQTRSLVEGQFDPGRVLGVEIEEIYAQRNRGSFSIDTWQVKGVLTVDSDRTGFLAVVRTTCDDHADIGCWTLQRFSLDATATPQ